MVHMGKKKIACLVLQNAQFVFQALLTPEKLGSRVLIQSGSTVLLNFGSCLGISI